VEDIFGPPLGDPPVEGLETGPDPGDGAVVVCPLLVDDTGEATLPLVQVIGDVGDEVGVGAVALAHDPVLVVTEEGCLEPEGAILLVGHPPLDEALDNPLHLAVGVEARFQEVDIEPDVKGTEILVLFTAQKGDGETADVVQVVGVAGGGDAPLVGGDGLPEEVCVGDVDDVFPLIAVGGPVRVIRPLSEGTCLDGTGEVLDLLSGVVVVELTGDVVPHRSEKPADDIADCGSPAMADVEGTGGVGADEFHLNFGPLPDPGAAVLITIPGDPFQGVLPGRGSEGEVDEPGASDIDPLEIPPLDTGKENGGDVTG